MREEKIKFNNDKKFDIQLSQSLVQERRLGEIFLGANLELAKFELKTETWQWKRTGNIAIEYQCDGRPSGISTTEADFWVHQLCDDDGSTLIYFIFPVEQLKRICRAAIRAGHFRKGGGDGGRFDNVLLKVEDINKWMFSSH
jgi:hypothetical protein